MAIVTLILGESGTGKSTSLRNMNHETTFIFQTIKKPLPFRGSKFNKENGNIMVTDNYESLIKGLLKLDKQDKFTDVIIDDSQYIMANEFMRRAKEKGFEKFTEIGEHYWKILDTCNSLENVNVYILSHTEESELGKVKIKTIVKLLDDKITLEGLFTIVLRTCVEGGEYFFRTKNNGQDTVKSPFGMFEEELIPNDLLTVKEKIKQYYEED